MSALQVAIVGLLLAGVRWCAATARRSSRSGRRLDHGCVLVHVVDLVRQPGGDGGGGPYQNFAGIRPSSAPMFIVMQLIGCAVAIGLLQVLYPATPTSAQSSSSTPTTRRRCPRSCSVRASTTPDGRRWRRRSNTTVARQAGRVALGWHRPGLGDDRGAGGHGRARHRRAGLGRHPERLTDEAVRRLRRWR